MCVLELLGCLDQDSPLSELIMSQIEAWNKKRENGEISLSWLSGPIGDCEPMSPRIMAMLPKNIAN